MGAGVGRLNENQILSELLQKGFITSSELTKLEEDLETTIDPSVPVFGRRIDLLISRGSVTKDAVQQVVEDLELERVEQTKVEEWDINTADTLAHDPAETIDGGFEDISARGEAPEGEERFGHSDPRPMTGNSDFTPTGMLSDEEIESEMRKRGSAPIPSSKKASQTSDKSRSRTSAKLRISQELLDRHLKEATPIKDLPVENWDRYLFVNFLGEGGMGKVYKGYDPYLKRYVALKFIRGDDTDLSRRFIQEAQAQAKVEHRNVCKVYEVGEVQDKLYIAMQFIEGHTLSRARKEMTLEKKIRVMRDICEGVHAAHRSGLIHRDLKPANIMVEQTEEGLVPYVMDFGLARELEATGLTQAGVVMGTPLYMAPEQARGDISLLDRRTDVYSLGATFYETFVGQAPFKGKSGMDILMKVLQEDPLPMAHHDPTIPPDLDTIVMKCLEKEPQRRYDSARELAEDFQRYLDDEPILARRTSIGYRLAKKAKKHKALVALASAAAIVVIAVLSLWWRGRIDAANQTTLAVQFGRAVNEMESVVRYAYMLPEHVVDAHVLLADRMADVTKTMKQFGKIGDGPGNYALGRGELAEEDYNAALMRLQEAWDSNYHAPEVAYALGRALGEVGETRRTRAMRDSNKENRARSLEKINKDFFQPAVLYLQQGRDARGESSEYVEALLNYYDKDARCATKNKTAALRQTNAALVKSNWLYEARKLEGDVYRSSGDEKSDQGDYKEALKDYEKAKEAYRQTVNMARSDKVGYEGLCNVWNEILIVDLYQGTNPENSFKSALESCGNAIKVNPRSTKGYDGLADAYVRYGNYLFDHGNDPTQPLSEAIETARTSLKIDSIKEDVPQTVGDRYLTLATAIWMNGLVKMYNGDDPTPLLTESLSNFKIAVEKDPLNAESYLNMATAYTTLSQYQMKVGKDPKQALDSAMQSFSKSVALDPNFAEAYGNMGKLHWQQAQAEMQGGADPGPTLKMAVEELQKALQVNHKYSLAYDDLGITYTIEGIYAIGHGQDPSGALDKAIENYQSSLKANPDVADTYNNLGEAYRYKGRYLYMSGGKPQNDFEHAIANYNKALQIDPQHPDAYSNMGNVYSLQADIQVSEGANPSDSLATAVKSISKAIGIDASYPDYYINLADAYLVSARYKLFLANSSESDLKSAGDAAHKALDANPDSSDALLRLGEVERLLAQWDDHSGKAASTHLEAAANYLKQAQDKNENDAFVFLALARLDSTGRPDAARIHDGTVMAEKALILNPRLVAAKAVKGRLLLRQAELETDTQKRTDLFEKALLQMQKAIQENRYLQREFKQDLEAASNPGGK